MVRRNLIVLAAALLTLVGATAAAEPDARRQSELLYRLKHDCGSCHGMTMKGGLAPPLVPEALVERDVDTLVAAILEGRPGTPMPPWAFELSPDEARWLVERLQAGLESGRAP